MEHDPDDLTQPQPPGTMARRTGPSAFMRFLVVVFGVFFFGTGRAVREVGGAVALVVGVLLQLVGVAAVAIAVGLVEWLQRRRR